VKIQFELLLGCPRSAWLLVLRYMYSSHLQPLGRGSCPQVRNENRSTGSSLAPQIGAKIGAFEEVSKGGGTSNTIDTQAETKPTMILHYRGPGGSGSLQNASMGFSNHFHTIRATCRENVLGCCLEGAISTRRQGSEHLTL
jgi:hypothetical protein